MSFTVSFSPPANSSFNDDIIYTVKSDKTTDPVTYPNYKFIGDVYIGGSLVARLKKDPNPVTGVGVFNIGQIVRSFAALVFNPGVPSAGVFAQQFGTNQFSIDVQMKFGEEYNFTGFLNISVDSIRTFFNTYNKRLFGSTSSMIAKIGDFFTNRPLSQTTGRVMMGTQYYFIPVAISGITPVTVNIATVNLDGTISPVTPVTLTPSQANSLILLNVSPQAINASVPGLINSNTSGYFINAGTANNLNVQIICANQYTPYPIHWLNQYGGFDTHLFTQVSRRSYAVEKTSFGKLPYTMGSDGIPLYKSANGIYNEVDSVYASQITETMILNTDNLVDPEYRWLEDLIFSPMIYIELNGYLYPISITDTSYEVKKSINDSITNLTINIKFSKEFNAQYR